MTFVAPPGDSQRARIVQAVTDAFNALGGEPLDSVALDDFIDYVYEAVGRVYLQDFGVQCLTRNDSEIIADAPGMTVALKFWDGVDTCTPVILRMVLDPVGGTNEPMVSWSPL